RDSELAQDAVTLDPVIYDAMLRTEKMTGKHYDTIITLQATSPLLSIDTLNNAIKDFTEKNYDTYISAVNKPHLSWTRINGECVPNYTARLNRQQLPPNYLEAGAFLITKRECVQENTRIGKKVSVYEMPEKEAVDIDSYSDWIICEQELKKKKIILRVDGHKTLGMGHIYRCLTLAYNLTGHDIIFVTKEEHQEGLKKLQDSHMKVHTISSNEDFYAFIKNWKPDIIVNDCLNTEADYIENLKSLVNRVVTLEDIGPGAELAHASINALYEDNTIGGNYYWGEKYVCLKDEFLIANPSEYSEQVKNIVVIFGGSDPSNFTERIYRLAQASHRDFPNIHFDFILGAGYDNSVHKITTLPNLNINVVQDVKRISDYLAKADLAFTSQGRTVYELACMGVPAIVLAQNERETKHTFAQMNNGFLNLGLGINVNDDTINKTYRFIVETPQLRKEMRDLMLKHDLRKGIERVTQIILQDED
ncbi:MAG: hypothetical protein J6A25_01680, partial [Lachnospiraceae bacterium]|nr:hypothetical protein [Lachnospiraceae bacterium]